jgi:hypothetical protein
MSVPNSLAVIGFSAVIRVTTFVGVHCQGFGFGKAA